MYFKRSLYDEFCGPFFLMNLFEYYSQALIACSLLFFFASLNFVGPFSAT